MNHIYFVIVLSLLSINCKTIFEPVTDLGKNILQASEAAVHDLANKTVDAAKFTKAKAEDILHHPKHQISNTTQELLQPVVNKRHPHLRSITNRYTQVR